MESDYGEDPGAMQFLVMVPVKRRIAEPFSSVGKVPLQRNEESGSQLIPSGMISRVNADQSPCGSSPCGSGSRRHSPCGSESRRQNQGGPESRRTKSPSGTEGFLEEKISSKKKKGVSSFEEISLWGVSRSVPPLSPGGNPPL